MMKKSEQTKAKLVDAVINLINKGQKISVASISKEAKTAYGSFYRYFNNLDEIHEAAIINVVLEVAESLDNQAEKENQIFLRFIIAWYIAIDLYKDTIQLTGLLITLPALMKHGFSLTHDLWLVARSNQAKRRAGIK